MEVKMNAVVVILLCIALNTCTIARRESVVVNIPTIQEMLETPPLTRDLFSMADLEELGL